MYSGPKIAPLTQEKINKKFIRRRTVTNFTAPYGYACLLIYSVDKLSLYDEILN
jgi:hypothetical protein